MRIETALVERIAGFDARALLDEGARVVGHVELVRFAHVVGDDHDALALLFRDVDAAAHGRDRGLTLGLARFEDFFDARETRDDVLLRDAAGVEGTQRCV